VQSISINFNQFLYQMVFIASQVQIGNREYCISQVTLLWK